MAPIFLFLFLFLLSSNTVLPVKSLIAIILVACFCVLVVQEFNCTVIVVSGSWGGKVGWRWLVRTQNAVLFSCSPEAVVPSSNWM